MHLRRAAGGGGVHREAWGSRKGTETKAAGRARLCCERLCVTGAGEAVVSGRRRARGGQHLRHGVMRLGLRLLRLQLRARLPRAVPVSRGATGGQRSAT